MRERYNKETQLAMDNEITPMMDAPLSTLDIPNFHRKLSLAFNKKRSQWLRLPGKGSQNVLTLPFTIKSTESHQLPQGATELTMKPFSLILIHKFIDY